MRGVSDASEYYEVSIEGRVIVIRTLGAWDKHVANHYFEVIKDTIRQLPPGQPWATFVDFTRWDVLDNETFAIGAEIIKYCDAHGRGNGAFMIGSMAVGQRMLEHHLLNPETSARHFHTEEAARQWLDSLGYFDIPDS